MSSNAAIACYSSKLLEAMLHKPKESGGSAAANRIPALLLCSLISISGVFLRLCSNGTYKTIKDNPSQEGPRVDTGRPGSADSVLRLGPLRFGRPQAVEILETWRHPVCELRLRPSAVCCGIGRSDVKERFACGISAGLR